MMTEEKFLKAGYGDEPIEMTAEEIIQIKADRAAYLAALPTELWKKQISETDAKLPRFAEDLIDVLTEDQRTAIAPATLAVYEDKKQLRAKKPDNQKGP